MPNHVEYGDVKVKLKTQQSRLQQALLHRYIALGPIFESKGENRYYKGSDKFQGS